MLLTMHIQIHQTANGALNFKTSTFKVFTRSSN